MKLKPCLSVLAMLAAASSWAQFRIQALPVFSNYGSSSGVIPLSLTVENRGRDAKGAIRVSTNSFQTEYPIDLPRGSSKRLVAYPAMVYASEISIDLETDQGSVHTNYQPPFSSDPTAQTVLLIGDSEGDLIFLRPKPSDSAIGKMWDCYVKPELAPDRAIAYSGLTSVVLGEGAERLSDGAVEALHLFLLGGGTVAFMGGASSPSLADPRWADVAPVSPRQPVAVDHVALLDNLASTPVRGITLLRCVPYPESIVRTEGQNVILARRDCGFGKTVFFAFDPLDNPLTRWPARKRLFEKVLRPLDGARVKGYLSEFGFRSAGSYNPYGYSMGTGTFSPVGRAPGVAGTAGADPFSTQLPPPTKVFWILAFYFVAVVPVNFLLLRKFKRGELAWLTAPVISVAFAGAFFSEARSLYSSSLSTATTGLLVGMPGSKASLFAGRSIMFFPNGGTYDLKMGGLEAVGVDSEPDSSGGRDSGLVAELNAVDNGEVLLNHMSVGSLAFREIAYQQHLPSEPWIDVKLTPKTGGAKLSVSNVSGSTLLGASALVAGQTFFLGNLAPGTSKTVDLPATIVPDQAGPPGGTAVVSGGPATPALSGLAEWTESTRQIAIKATIDRGGFGPKVGNEVRARRSVTLAYFPGLHYGRVEL